MSRPVLAAAERIATSVSVLTVRDGDAAHGTTVSSVCVVSRAPLMICVGLRAGSGFSATVRRVGEFVVNVLTGAQAPIADWFASPDRPRGLAQFDRVTWDPHPTIGAPVLGGAAAVLVARLTQEVAAGDHDLLIAEVTDASQGLGTPLVAYAGGLHRAEFSGVPRRRGLLTTTGSVTSLD